MQDTGRPPARARPIPTPTIVLSARGEFRTRPGNVVDNPRVSPNTSPLGSSRSCPERVTRESASRRRRSTSRIASSMVARRASAASTSPVCSRRASQSGGKGARASRLTAGFGDRNARSAAARTFRSHWASCASSSCVPTPDASIAARRTDNGSAAVRTSRRSDSLRYTRSSSAFV